MIGALPSFFRSPHKIAGLPSSEPILVALSGGADSSALLDMMRGYRDKGLDFPLYAAHVNHNIRCEDFGNEAARDESFCRELCKSLGIELFVESIDVPALASRSGQSLETAAREARYAFFAKIMGERNIRILVTAHNADDNLETQIFNLCRGCGLDGICGIPECRRFEEVDGVIVRPMLSASKSEIIRYCAENNVGYVTDSTNFIDDCTRNKLRLNVIPQLRELFGSPEAAGIRLAHLARENNDYILSAANEFIKAQSSDGLDVSDLTALHPAVAKKVLMIRFEDYSGAKLEQIHAESLLAFAKSGKDGSISLPSLSMGEFRGGRLRFTKEEREKPTHSSYRIPLAEDVTYIEGRSFAVSVTCGNASPIFPVGEYALYSSATLCADRDSLIAANRSEGDKIYTGKMHKKLKKLMCDKKVPPIDRDDLPLIFSNDELIYAPLCAISDGARAEKNKPTVTISIFKKI